MVNSRSTQGQFNSDDHVLVTASNKPNRAILWSRKTMLWKTCF